MATTQRSDVRPEHQLYHEYSVEVDQARCKACGLCAHYCPKDCFILSDSLNASGYRPYRFKEGLDCTACGLCGTACPDLAIRIFSEWAEKAGATASAAPTRKAPR